MRRPSVPEDFSNTWGLDGASDATFAIGEAGAANAGLFAVALLAIEDAGLAQKLADFRARQTQAVLDMTLD